MNITIRRTWIGWLACVNGVYGYSTTSGCEAIGNALVYYTPGVTVATPPRRRPTLREIYWFICREIADA